MYILIENNTLKTTLFKTVKDLAYYTDEEYHIIRARIGKGFSNWVTDKGNVYKVDKVISSRRGNKNPRFGNYGE